MTRINLAALERAWKIPASRVIYWQKSGSFVTLDAPSRALTSSRNWTQGDLFRLMLLNRMVDAGLPPEAGLTIPRLDTIPAKSFFVVQSHGENLFVAGADAGERFDGSVCAAGEISELITSPFEPLALHVFDLDSVSRDTAEAIEMIEALSRHRAA